MEAQVQSDLRRLNHLHLRGTTNRDLRAVECFDRGSFTEGYFSTRERFDDSGCRFDRVWGWAAGAIPPGIAYACLSPPKYRWWMVTAKLIHTQAGWHAD